MKQDKEYNRKNELLNSEKIQFSEVGKEIVLNYYEQLNNQRRQELYDTTDALQAFGDGLISESSYDAMAIYQMANSITNPSDDDKELIKEYFDKTNINHEKQDFILAILGDLEFIDQKSEQYFDQNENWQEHPELMELEKIKDVLNNINLESFIIKAAQVFNRLNNAHFYTEKQNFVDIKKTDSFYTPICEVIGLDGMAMAFRDLTTRLNFEHSDDKENLKSLKNRTEKLFNRANNIPIEQVFEDLGFCQNEEKKYIANQVAGQKINQQNIAKLGDFVIETDDERTVSGVWRYKAKGSIMKKITTDLYHNQPPMDLIGLTFIVNEDNFKNNFTNFIEKIHSNDRLSLKSAPGKNSPIYIQGAKSWVDQIENNLHDEYIMAHTKIVSPSDFQVAKATMDIYYDDEPVGIEVQFISKMERLKARIGESAHFIYKLGKNLNKNQLAKYLDYMQQIYYRKPHLKNKKDTPTIKTESLNRVNQIKTRFGLKTS